MTGTYYAAASPNAPAFVKIGEYVKVGQTLCIIEAMKLMNTIESEHEGEIVQILVSNAQMVTAGQVMMKIRP
uniref:Biotin carboxyl carrier protein of acetyl-CoA carboxylase n=1 Tax=Cyanidiococcus yangmingshanensis TaxID=2690220 RepID=A0A7G5VUI6_9RHOD|nr:acetyl-CoA carboxylase biotin carrier protein [Cyanidiococcus yangmingshanensis]QMX77353.1 acetyl-CoA carboxylase biotin carrier protein [Cyanidiococcus yangmingshanensis]